MSKIAILTDSHFGIKNDSKYFYDYAKKFLDNTFFPKLKEAGVKVLLHGGDLFDRRKYSNFETLAQTKQNFLDPLSDLGIELSVIVGNHDVYYKNTNKLNSPEQLIGHYPNVKVYTEYDEVNIDGLDIALVPWINQENVSSTLTKIDETNANILLGHLEINGFDMAKGIACHDGLDRNIFSKFELVMSGHFHLKNTKANITYLGCPWELDFGDFDTDKGFYFLDTETKELEFFKNPYKMYHKIYYSGNQDLENFENFKGSFVKVIIQDRKDRTKWEEFLSNLYNVGCASIDIIEEDVLTQTEEETNIDMSLDEFSVIRQAVEEYENLGDEKEAVINCLQELYNEV